MLNRKYRSFFHYFFFAVKCGLTDWSVSCAVKEKSGLKVGTKWCSGDLDLITNHIPDPLW